jgi:hypothetical protein
MLNIGGKGVGLSAQRIVTATSLRACTTSVDYGEQRT